MEEKKGAGEGNSQQGSRDEVREEQVGIRKRVRTELKLWHVDLWSAYLWWQLQNQL